MRFGMEEEILVSLMAGNEGFVSQARHFKVGYFTGISTSSFGQADTTFVSGKIL